MIETASFAESEKAPAISVIMPAFNDLPYLPAAIESLQCQSFKNFECIVVDDGSIDETPALLGQICRDDPRFRYVRREHEGSPGTARNLAVEQARGHILVFHDSDDIALPDRLQRIFKEFANRNDIGVVYHDYLIFDHNDPSNEVQYFKGRYAMPTGLIYKDLYAFGGLHSTLSASVLTHWYRHFVGQRPRAEIAIGEDYEFFLRISPAVPCAYIDAPLLRVRRRKPKHLSGDVVRSIESRLAELDYFEQGYPELVPELAKIRDKTRGILWFSLGRAYLWEGNNTRARAAFQEASDYYPRLNILAYRGVMGLGGGSLLRLGRKLRSKFFSPDSRLKAV